MKLKLITVHAYGCTVLGCLCCISVTSYYIMLTGVCLFGAYQHPCSEHAGYIGTDRSLQMGHDALLLCQLGIFNMHHHIDMVTHGMDLMNAHWVQNNFPTHYIICMQYIYITSGLSPWV